MPSNESADNNSLPTFDESRIAQFESDAVPQYRTVIRTVDMSKLSAAAIRALDDLTIAFGRQRADFLQQFVCVRGRATLNGATDWC